MNTPSQTINLALGLGASVHQLRGILGLPLHPTASIERFDILEVLPKIIHLDFFDLNIRSYWIRLAGEDVKLSRVTKTSTCLSLHGILPLPELGNVHRTHTPRSARGPGVHLYHLFHDFRFWLS